MLTGRPDALKGVAEAAAEHVPDGFVAQYYAHLPSDALENRAPEVLAAIAAAHYDKGRVRHAGEAIVDVDVPEHGPAVARIVTDDMPFLVDSVTMAFARHGLSINLLLHPLLRVVRDGDGVLRSISENLAGDGLLEAWILVEFDRPGAGALEVLAADLRAVLADVATAVRDWPAMREKAASIADALVGVDTEAAAFLRWLTHDHFTFLGAVDGEGHRLGLACTEELLEAGDGTLLVLGRSRELSRVHRPSRLDLVRVQAAGTAAMFVGLYTERAIRQAVDEIPVIRRKVASIVESSGIPPMSHSGKALKAILEVYPRDELFVAPIADIATVALAVLELSERRQVKAFVRHDAQAGLLSVQVYLPRDRYTTGTVWRIEQHLQALFGASSADSSSLLTDSVLARVHVLLPVDRAPSIDTARLDKDLADLTRTWAEGFHDTLVAEQGPDAAAAIERIWLPGLPAAYRDTYGAAAAVADLATISGLDDQGLAMRLQPGIDGCRLKLYRRAEPIALSAVLPVLENLGMTVIDQRPFELRPTEGPVVWLADFGLQPRGDSDPLGDEEVRWQFLRALRAVLEGEVENDGFNALVLAAKLTPEQIVILRAYAKYLRQAGTTFSESYLAQTLNANGTIAHLIVELFEARLDPAPSAPTDVDALGAAITAALADVGSLDDDRILTSFMRLAEATTRTSYYQRVDGLPQPFLAVKLDPTKIPELPLPRPMFEIWVYSPRTEGVHLRGGRVARGGIRWSDRREDFRTEVLGLMKAQMVKNAVIVPTGAKGGFVVKQPPSDPEALRSEVVTCYRVFISGLLSITDNIVGANVVPPPNTVRFDTDDPYLVVAADKGTATFSDIANELALAHGFWLGDAFASGGSTGYDHKKIAITARGAWESVRRHFRSVGVDADTAELTVVGIGDMSGDVFGNGMLRSPHLRLIGAFDHRHVFVDPTPEPATAFAERLRLFQLPRSSWADYSSELISEGGGVWPRSAKSIALSSQARQALGIETERLTPAELISAILRAPVDLLWNGGIGTYVKASTETNADVGDRANDAVRVNGADLRCKVVAEGGNLGFTQYGRVEFALKGGLINTDAIDNSAGVDCSDHEVNLKILLDAVVAQGALTTDARNALLVAMTDEVSELVLDDNKAQTLALANARHQASSMIDVHARYIRSLAAEGLLDRDIESLPTDRQLAERQAAGLGLTTPEFAVLLAYTKLTNTHEVLESRLPDDPAVESELYAYFPSKVRDQYAGAISAHRLRREIIATRIVNQMVNRAGISFDHRMSEETGATVPDITAAHIAAARIFELDRYWHEVDALALTASVQTPLLLDLRRLVERGVQWLLRRRRPPLDIAATVDAFASGAAALANELPDLLIGSDRDTLFADAARLVTSGVPDDLAMVGAGWRLLHLSFDLVEVSAARRTTVSRAAAVGFTLSDRLGLDWLRDRIDALPRADRWQSQSRGALRDDLSTEWRELTADVLRGDPFAEPAALVDAWCAANDRSVTRCRRVFADVRAGGVFNLATLSVAIRAVRNLVIAGAPPT
jgi:glutamate dehydrogenase